MPHQQIKHLSLDAVYRYNFHVPPSWCFMPKPAIRRLTHVFYSISIGVSLHDHQFLAQILRCKGKNEYQESMRWAYLSLSLNNTKTVHSYLCYNPAIDQNYFCNATTLTHLPFKTSTCHESILPYLAGVHKRLTSLKLLYHLYNCVLVSMLWIVLPMCSSSSFGCLFKCISDMRRLWIYRVMSMVKIRLISQYFWRLTFWNTQFFGNSRFMPPWKVTVEVTFRFLALFAETNTYFPYYPNSNPAQFPQPSSYATNHNIPQMHIPVSLIEAIC